MTSFNKKQLMDLIFEIEKDDNIETVIMKKLISDFCKHLYFIVSWYETHNYHKSCLGFSVKLIRKIVKEIYDNFSQGDVVRYLGNDEELKVFLIKLIFNFTEQLKKEPFKHFIIRTFIDPKFRIKNRGYLNVDISEIWDKDDISNN